MQSPPSPESSHRRPEELHARVCSDREGASSQLPAWLWERSGARAARLGRKRSRCSAYLRSRGTWDRSARWVRTVRAGPRYRPETSAPLCPWTVAVRGSLTNVFFTTPGPVSPPFPSSSVGLAAGFGTRQAWPAGPLCHSTGHLLTFLSLVSRLQHEAAVVGLSHACETLRTASVSQPLEAHRGRASRQVSAFLNGLPGDLDAPGI